MEAKELFLFVAYAFIFILAGAFFILYVPILISSFFGQNIVCTIASQSGLFCYNVLQNQIQTSAELPINWPVTLISWVINLTFLFGGAFLVLKAYHSKIKYFVPFGNTGKAAVKKKK